MFFIPNTTNTVLSWEMDFASFFAQRPRIAVLLQNWGRGVVKNNTLGTFGNGDSATGHT